MELTGSPADIALLRTLAPLQSLRGDQLVALARKTRRLQAPMNRILFREGDDDKHTYFLLSGSIDLLQEGEIVSSVRSGTDKAKHPLAHELPRPYSAVVTSQRVEYLQIEHTFLAGGTEMYVDTGAYHVSELSSTVVEEPNADDWMTALLQSKAFHKVPPQNIQAIFMRMQRRDYRAGDIVIKQGDEGDYFYVIVKGKCLVTRETPLNKDGIKLAELGMGDTFGEESLISEAKRNATVRLLTDGCLMQLSKEDFRALLNEPFLEWISYADAQQAVAQGAQWLDVRLPSEYEQFHAPGALNIPLHSLRLKMKSLDRDGHYIVVCDTGRRSSACAYILSERGFHASVLQGGLRATEIAAKSAVAR